MSVRHWLLLALLLGGLWGCALKPPATPSTAATVEPVAEDELPAGEGWWYARFFINRADGESPRWHIGTLIAGEVIAPLFDTHFPDIRIWRIHRRASSDINGHVFSFIFYSTADGAQRIYQTIGGNPVLAQLQRDGLVSRVGYDDVRTLSRPGIADTSDRKWPPLVQQTWPALIMGASRMWLDMVSLLAAGQPAEGTLEERYAAVNAEIGRIWAEQGQHALLHHLSAIYAYQPLLIRY